MSMTRTRCQPGRFIFAAMVEFAFTVPVVWAESSGERDARAAIEAREFRLHKVGSIGIAGGGYRGLDSRTGFPIYENGLGCINFGGIEKAERQYVAEFNATIYDYLKRHGLPPESRKPWLSQIQLPGKTFTRAELLARKADNPQPMRLTVDGDKMGDADGWTLQIRTVEETVNDQTIRSVRIIIGWRGPQRASARWDQAVPVDFFFGPKGSDTAFLRRETTVKGEPAYEYRVLDLRNGQWLSSQTLHKPKNNNE